MRLECRRRRRNLHVAELALHYKSNNVSIIGGP